jgi:hypothetical protein
MFYAYVLENPNGRLYIGQLDHHDCLYLDFHHILVGPSLLDYAIKS